MFTILFGAAALATAHVPAHQATPTARDLLDVALVVCPLNPSIAAMRGAARDARFSERDSNTVLALCSMYHKGRADQAGQMLRNMHYGE